MRSRPLRGFLQLRSGAYRRVPVRWRLGGGSAALTFVILAGFATVTDVLTDRHLSSAFYASRIRGDRRSSPTRSSPPARTANVQCSSAIVFDGSDLGAQIRFFSPQRQLLCSQTRAAPRHRSIVPICGHATGAGAPLRRGRISRRHRSTSPGSSGPTSDRLASSTPSRFRTSTRRSARSASTSSAACSPARSSPCSPACSSPSAPCGPVVELTEAAREIERTRDPTLRIPHPEAEDEVADLARTLESMLGALSAARTESESALMRQREFVADASHELRTPLTSVLANLELLADELDGEQADSAKSALRSTRRMRRLVADLLLLARADVGRQQPPPPDQPRHAPDRRRRRARPRSRRSRAGRSTPSRRRSRASATTSTA